MSDSEEQFGDIVDEELGDIVDEELTRVLEQYYENLNVSCFLQNHK